MSYAKVKISWICLIKVYISLKIPIIVSGVREEMGDIYMAPLVSLGVRQRLIQVLSRYSAGIKFERTHLTQ